MRTFILVISSTLQWISSLWQQRREAKGVLFSWVRLPEHIWINCQVLELPLEIFENILLTFHFEVISAYKKFANNSQRIPFTLHSAFPNINICYNQSTSVKIRKFILIP